MARTTEYLDVVRATALTSSVDGNWTLPTTGLAYARPLPSYGCQGDLLAASPKNRQAQLQSQDQAESLAEMDQDFARRIASGEAAAMREAVNEFLPQIHATALRMLRNEADADEVTQETFLRVWKNVGTWVPKGARLRTWVIRIAMNLCYDRLRKKGHGKSLPLEDAPETIDGAPSAVETIAVHDRSVQVDIAMSALPDRQRAAIQLVHFDEMSNIDAASIMDVSVEALESLLARGRRSLKTALLDQREELLGDV